MNNLVNSSELKVARLSKWVYQKDMAVKLGTLTNGTSKSNLIMWNLLEKRYL